MHQRPVIHVFLNETILLTFTKACWQYLHGRSSSVRPTVGMGYRGGRRVVSLLQAGGRGETCHGGEKPYPDPSLKGKKMFYHRPSPAGTQ